MTFKFLRVLIVVLLLQGELARTDYVRDLHSDDQSGLSINDVPAADRNHWMRIANQAVTEINGDPCSQFPFGVAVVNHTSNELVCVAANRVSTTGNPTQHGEITGIAVCSDVLRARGLTPLEMLAAWKDFSMYTTGEPCRKQLVLSNCVLFYCVLTMKGGRTAMCASALRWAGIKEVIWGSSIETILKAGRNQIYLPSSLILSASYSLGTQSFWLGSVLANETDPTFLHQYNETAPCPTHCTRQKVEGKRVSQCRPVPGWREEWERRKGNWEKSLTPRVVHDEL